MKRLLNIRPIIYILGEAGFGGRPPETVPASITFYGTSQKKKGRRS